MRVRGEPGERDFEGEGVDASSGVARSGSGGGGAATANASSSVTGRALTQPTREQELAQQQLDLFSQLEGQEWKKRDL